MGKFVGNVKIRVLTVNTHKGFTAFNRRFMLHELREAVRDTSADVVFLQEVLGEHEGWSKHKKSRDHWPPQPQYEFLADSIWHDHAYGRNAVYPEGHHGNALLSKYPISRWQNRDISLNGIERRGLLHCELNVQNVSRPVHTVCVHLSLRESHRQKQLARLAELVNSIPANEPLIVAGDFNDWRLKGQALLKQTTDLVEVFSLERGLPARTFPASMPTLRLDRIYIRAAESHAPVVLPKSPWSKLSDHRPLLAEVEL